jgi:hypothetical protein
MKGITMGRATAQRTSTLQSTQRERREAVPAEVYEGFDADAFNASASEYRRLMAQGGIDAAMSRYADEPVAVVYEPRS